jgi:hypothetical protein
VPRLNGEIGVTQDQGEDGLGHAATPDRLTPLVRGRNGELERRGRNPGASTERHMGA